MTEYCLAGLNTPERIRAWREKIGLMSIIVAFMGGVGFLTFGFTETVCPNESNRLPIAQVGTGNLIVKGYSYDLSDWKHPAVDPYFSGDSSPLFDSDSLDGWHAGGADASFLFQDSTNHCAGIITQVGSDAYPQRLFPCNVC